MKDVSGASWVVRDAESLLYSSRLKTHILLLLYEGLLPVLFIKRQSKAITQVFNFHDSIFHLRPVGHCFTPQLMQDFT